MRVAPLPTVQIRFEGPGCPHRLDHTVIAEVRGGEVSQRESGRGDVAAIVTAAGQNRMY